MGKRYRMGNGQKKKILNIAIDIDMDIDLCRRTNTFHIIVVTREEMERNEIKRRNTDYYIDK